MDFLTGMAYWGIIVLVVVNAFVVTRMKVEIHHEEQGMTHHEEHGKIHHEEHEEHEGISEKQSLD